jgi:hypothetical protein
LSRSETRAGLVARGARPAIPTEADLDRSRISAANDFAVTPPDNDVEKVTGRPALTVERYITEHPQLFS